MSDTGTARSSEPRRFLSLAISPFNFSDTALGLLECPSKLVRIKSNTTLGTGITIAFEPTGVLLALVAAPRTGNLDSFFLEHGETGSTPLTLPPRQDPTITFFSAVVGRDVAQQGALPVLCHQATPREGTCSHIPLIS